MHTALRSVWKAWDRADPARVEEALRAASQDIALSPAQRSYAQLIQGYARLRRGDLRAARQTVDSLAYVNQWLVLGPFDNNGKLGFTSSLGPESEVGAALNMGRAYSGKEGKVVRWRAAPAAFPFGWIDAGALLRPYRSICAFFASHAQQAELKEPRPVSLWVGTRGAYRLYWNGEERLSDAAYRGHDFDRRAVRVWLQPGINRLTVEVCSDEASPMLSVRVGDAAGMSAPEVEWSVEGGHVPPPPAAVEPPAGLPLAAPLDELEQRLKLRPNDLVVQEDMARYLAVTDGEDPALHQARDLAATVARRSPSISRYLLAAELEQDRNRKAEWLGLAEALPVPSNDAGLRDFLQLLVARAEWVESGPSPRLALPLYEQVLSVDPDQVDALLGKARRLHAAGLPRSATALLESALQRRPHAVALASAYTTALTLLGRTQAAEQASSLYSALRFDDHRPLVERLRLAQLKRDTASVDHWSQRLLALGSDNSWLIGVVADAQLGVGRPRRALAIGQRALALAPEDTDALREISDLYGLQGQQEQQLATLQRILGLSPQDDEVRRYVEALEPSVGREDEAYAWEPERFLKDRLNVPEGYHQRTLLDLEVTTVYESGAASRFHQVVFQPLSDAGAALARQYTFSYQADRQQAQLRGARVYRNDGKVDMAVESAEGAADNPELSMYTSARTVYVQFPRLEPGDVVELRYRIDDVGDRNEWSGYFGELVYLQSDSPVEHARYVVTTPKERPLYVDVQRLPQLTHRKGMEGDRHVHEFAVNGLPALVPEPSMPPWPEVAGFIHVSTYPSYEALSQWYWGLSRDQLRLDADTKRLAQRLVEGKSTVREKVEAIYGWVVKNTRYVALEFGIYGYKPRSCVQTVARGWGDCKDKATVIVALLGEVGIDATLVMVRTGMRGRFQSDVASLAPFDHAIAYVPELDLYLDGTAEFTGTRELPVMDQGAFALQVNRGEGRLVTLPENDPKTHVTRREVVLQLLPEGSGKIHMSYETRGPTAAGWRQRYAAEGTRRERVVADLRRLFSTLELAPGEKGLKMSGLEDFEQPVRAEVHGTLQGIGRSEAGRVSLGVLPSPDLVSTYAQLAERRTELDVGAFATRDESYRVVLRPGQEVLAMPSQLSLRTRFGEATIETQQRADEVEIHSRLLLTVRRVSPEDYAEFRSFCQTVDQAMAARLVLATGEAKP